MPFYPLLGQWLSFVMHLTDEHWLAAFLWNLSGGQRTLQFSSHSKIQITAAFPPLSTLHFWCRQNEQKPASFLLLVLPPATQLFFFFFVPIYAFFFFLGNIFLCKADYNTFTSWRPWSKRVWPLLFLWKICSGRRPTHLFITNSPLFSVGHSVLGLHERIGWSNS